MDDWIQVEEKMCVVVDSEEEDFLPPPNKLSPKPTIQPKSMKPSQISTNNPKSSNSTSSSNEKKNVSSSSTRKSIFDWNAEDSEENAEKTQKSKKRERSKSPAPEKQNRKKKSRVIEEDESESEQNATKSGENENKNQKSNVKEEKMKPVNISEQISDQRDKMDVETPPDPESPKKNKQHQRSEKKSTKQKKVVEKVESCEENDEKISELSDQKQIAGPKSDDETKDDSNLKAKISRKEPPSAFNLFLNAKRKEVKAENPSATPRDITKKISLLWEKLLKEEKQQFEEEAEKKRLEYEKEFGPVNKLSTKSNQLESEEKKSSNSTSRTQSKNKKQMKKRKREEEDEESDEEYKSSSAVPSEGDDNGSASEFVDNQENDEEKQEKKTPKQTKKKSKTQSKKKKQTKKRKQEEDDDEGSGEEFSSSDVTPSEGDDNEYASHSEEMDDKEAALSKSANIPSRRIIFSGISQDHEAISILSTMKRMKKSVRVLSDFSFCDTYHVKGDRSTTHVVVDDTNPKRTEKVLLGIAKGSWIVTPQWILDSMNNQGWVPENKYEISQFPGAAISRKAKLSNSPGLFHKLKFFINGIFQALPSFHVLITFQDGLLVDSLDQSCDYIINFEEGWKPPKDIPVVSHQWILDCLTQGKRLNHSKFLQ